ncbi:MAG: tRNA pseudouridine(38-40) synthase TruA [Nitrospirales bacterium]|nr:tRNA pseudouridine(38-40) synthase TruA [Nitrospirales bacterium]
MRIIRITVQYDGTAYSGWQVQPNSATLQQILQERIGEIAGERLAVTGAGRTDAGVHALAQVAAFRTTSRLSPEVFKRALNARLPASVRILDAAEAKGDFHPRFDAVRKAYFYLIANTSLLSPFLYRYVWQVPVALDIEAMRRAAALLEGTHDFSSFRASGCGAKSPERTLFSLLIERHDSLDFMTVHLRGEFLKVRIEGDAFLRHMVRNIVGTLVEAGKGKVGEERMRRILLSRDRKCAGPTAPARGLFLERIFYPGEE